MASFKRVANLFLCLSLLCLLTACSLIEDFPVFETKPAHNTIAPKALTKKEKELIDLLSGTDQEIYLFSYNADREYCQLDLWVELYKDGVLIDPNAGGLGMIFQETDKDLTGTLAVTITHTPDYRWRFSHRSKASGASSASAPNTNYLPEAARGYHQIQQAQTIEPGKEIILYQSMFSEDSTVGFIDQTFLERPELLEAYDYVHLIKCKFSTAPEDL